MADIYNLTDLYFEFMGQIEFDRKGVPHAIFVSSGDMPNSQRRFPMCERQIRKCLRICKATITSHPVTVMESLEFSMAIDAIRQARLIPKAERSFRLAL